MKVYRPLITIITAVFNGQDTLEHTIKSLLGQSYKNIQFIVVDGASTDNTIKIINKYQNFINIFVSEPDFGIYDAWNKGLSRATGDWVSFLGSGDIYERSAIEDYVKYIDCNQFYNVDFISSQVELGGQLNSNKIIGDPWSWGNFKRYMNVAHVGSLHNMKLFNMYGSFDTSYRICGDYEFLLRANKNLHAKFMNLLTVKMLPGGVSSSIASLKEARKAKVNTGNLSPYICFYDFLFAVFKFHLKKTLHYIYTAYKN